MTLLEQYAKRLAISEAKYAEVNPGQKLDRARKIAIATTLNNTSCYLTESFENSKGTQLANLGDYKRFCLNLITVTLPQLIAYDVVMVYPMPSITGYISYVKFTAGSNKGQINQGHVFNSPFRLGDFTGNYTGDAVVENIQVVQAGQAQDVVPAWTPVLEEVFVDNLGAKKTIKLMDTTTATGEVAVTYPAFADNKFSVTPQEGHTYKFAYRYDNVVIPQNDLPILNAEMSSITLRAKARRIAVYYSNLANYQASKDYGFDMGDQLAKQAASVLEYEIDTEVTGLLIDNASAEDSLTFNKALPMGISKAEHYEGFAEIIEEARKIVYKKTKKYMPNYMLISPEISPILTFMKGWNPASINGMVSGPYFAGSLNGLKVYVTPNIADNEFVLGVHYNDMAASAAVYAPYMPIIPTQLLEYADGGTTQGYSTMYDLQILNPELLVKGKVINDPATANAQVINTKAA